MGLLRRRCGGNLFLRPPVIAIPVRPHRRLEHQGPHLLGTPRPVDNGEWGIVVLPEHEHGDAPREPVGDLPQIRITLLECPGNRCGDHPTPERRVETPRLDVLTLPVDLADGEWETDPLPR